MSWQVQALQLGWPYGNSADERRAQVRQRLRATPAADLIMLPELWPVGFFRFDEYAAEAEPFEGPTVTMLAEVARERSCHVLTGSFVERTPDGRLHNTCVLLGPDGDALLTYRKMHLFGYQSRERELLTPGQESPVVATPLGRIGVGTCYDLRFPEFHRALVDRGAEIILVPSAWPRARTEHWKLFLRARALENQVFLVGCNMAGTDGEAVYAGASAVIGPTGDVLVEAGEHDQMLEATIDLNHLQQYRTEFPVLGDRVLDVPATPTGDRL